MNRRDFLTTAPTATLAGLATASASVAAVPTDPMVLLVSDLFRLRDAYCLIPDPTGDINTPQHKAMDDRMSSIEAEIEALPITSREGLAAYCRYLAKEAELFEIDPEQFAKIIDWAGVPVSRMAGQA